MRRWLTLWKFPIIFFVAGFTTFVGISHIVDFTLKPVTVISHPVKHIWTKADSLAYAHDQMEVFAGKQFACLSNLWGKESAWDPKKQNDVKVMGKKAGGIPQLLGLSPLVLPVIQIDRGLSYIYYRWTTPCKAWEHWKHYYWY